MTDFFELIRARKSIRSFSEKSVSRTDIEKIIESATYAPTNCNQQLWNFVVIEDRDLKERLIKEAASNTLFRRAPILVAVTYDGWNNKEAIQGASLAVGHMLLAATALGIGALPMNSYGADSKIKKILHIPQSQTICCFVVFGYPDNRAQIAPKVPRRPYTETLHWNAFKEIDHPPFTYNSEDWTVNQIKGHQKYYCRKTFLGKEMDIVNDLERQVVADTFSEARAPLLDLLTYDGAYIKQLPKIESVYVDLLPETSLYTQEAATLSVGDTKHISFVTLENIGSRKVRTISMNFKLERVPPSFASELFEKSHQILEDEGELIIVSRKSNFFLSIFFTVIKVLFGREIRNTGIYNFFGPYTPLSLTNTLKSVKKAGFSNVTYQGYFLLPAFYEQAYQMYLQYKRSEGSSYLHREKQTNILTKTISALLKMQGFRRFGRLGSVVVIRCKK